MSFLLLSKLVPVYHVRQLQPQFHIAVLRLSSLQANPVGVSVKSQSNLLLLRFVEYLLEESISPLDMVRNNIKSVILAQRKKALLDKMQASVYEKAKRDRAFEVYVGSPTLYNAD
jgi:hypothetical protein